MKSKILSLFHKYAMNNQQHCDQTGNKTRKFVLKAKKSEVQKQRRKACKSKDL